MLILIAGLVIFLGVHSLDLFATQKRHELIEQKGEGTYKGLYTLLSLIGFALIIWGYGVSRSQGTFLWLPSAGMRHITVVLSLVAFVLLAATYFKGSWIKIRLGHPMALAVKVWAFGHLISNGRLGDVLLFGFFPDMGHRLLCHQTAPRPACGHRPDNYCIDTADGHRYPRWLYSLAGVRYLVTPLADWCESIWRLNAKCSEDG